MRKIYITFGGGAYDETTKKIVNDAPVLGADEVWVYDDYWVTQQEFYKHNQWLWQHHHKRGFGWYAWKPLILLDALSKLEDGDIVLYTDSDTYPIKDFSVLFEICNKEGVMLFEASHHQNRPWCKRDCYVVMGQDEEKYWNSKAGCARFMLFQKGKWKPYQFLMEWLTYCVNPLATTFDPSVLKPELDGFIEHRTEQAIMTLLAHKYGFKLYREADQSGQGYPNDRDLYGELFMEQNEWNKKNDLKNITAPVQPSKYRNVPETKRAYDTSKSYASTKSKKSVAKFIVITRNKIKIGLGRIFVKFKTYCIPESVKVVLKKKLRDK